MPGRLQTIYLQYFQLTRWQRITLAWMGVILTLLLGVRLWLAFGKKKSLPEDALVLTTLTLWRADSSLQGQEALTDRERTAWQSPTAAEPPIASRWRLSAFDPNTASAEALRAMGFREKSVQTLVNYRAKGGRFRTPDDIDKLYGLYPDEKAMIKPYVLIAAAPGTPNGRNLTERNYNTNADTRRPKTLAINLADSAAWEALPGIGPTLSRRIVQFREALGGFHSVQQVAETYGLPDSTFQRISPWLQADAVPIRKLDLNADSYEVLNRHPYISAAQARFIVAYRKQHAGIPNAAVLLQTPELFSHGWLQQIQPYLQ